MLKCRKLCVVTGTRADYGLLKHLIAEINNAEDFELVLFVTGTHLSRDFGNTFTEIEEDGFLISRKIDLDLSSDTPCGVAASTALSLVGFSKAYADVKPDLIVLLGDRFELLGAAISAMYHHIPIAHLHGGEVTVGAMDESIRHSITKFSHIHFAATDIYRNRILQLGEDPNLVFNVGGLGVDAIKRIKLLSKDELEQSLGIKFMRRNLLVTYHPVTLECSSSSSQMEELLRALSPRKDCRIIFTMPNADPDSRIIYNLIKNFVRDNPNCCLYASLGQIRYFSCIAQVDAVIGNSSSGLLEAPTFKKATINIGDRQSGRLKASSVIDCNPDCDSISAAIDKVFTDAFQHRLINTINPYGDGGSVTKIMDILKKLSYVDLIKKKFYDMQRF